MGTSPMHPKDIPFSIPSHRGQQAPNLPKDLSQEGGKEVIPPLLFIFPKQRSMGEAHTAAKCASISGDISPLYDHVAVTVQAPQ